MHQLRVATRRAAATVRIFDALLPQRRMRRLNKCLRKIRRAAGTARDLDVLADRLRAGDCDRFPATLDAIDRLTSLESSQLDAACGVFCDWWTAERIRQLQQTFERFLEEEHDFLSQSSRAGGVS